MKKIIFIFLFLLFLLPSVSAIDVVVLRHNKDPSSYTEVTITDDYGYSTIKTTNINGECSFNISEGWYYVECSYSKNDYINESIYIRDDDLNVITLYNDLTIPGFTILACFIGISMLLYFNKIRYWGM